MRRLTEPMRGDADGDFERIRLLVRRRRGVDLAHYKSSYVHRRLLARIRATRAESAGAYARLVANDPGEAGRLLAALSTKVTQFFRNPGLYAFLELHVVPEIFEGAVSGRTIRLWSAGCATGEEAWSLSALVEAEATKAPGASARVVGTDVDREAIAAARRAIYPRAAIHGLPSGMRRSCFVESGDGRHVSPAPSLRSRTRFRVESLLVPPAAGAFDLVLCRNVLIYYEPALQQKILGHMAAALRPGGFLALGRVERLAGEPRAAFEVVHVRERVYRRL